MSGHRVIRRYARALLDAARERELLQEILEDLDAIEALLNEAPAIRDYCLHERPSRATAETFVATAFVPYVSELTGNALQLAALHRRLALIPYLPKVGHELVDREQGKVPVRVEVASEPEPAFITDLTERLRQRLSREPVLDVTVNEHLLGGFCVEWDNRRLDQSVRDRLNRTRRHLQGETRS